MVCVPVIIGDGKKGEEVKKEGGFAVSLDQATSPNEAKRMDFKNYITGIAIFILITVNAGALAVSIPGPAVAAKPPPRGLTYTDQEAICVREGVLQARQSVYRALLGRFANLPTGSPSSVGILYLLGYDLS